MIPEDFIAVIGERFKDIEGLISSMREDGLDDKTISELLVSEFDKRKTLKPPTLPKASKFSWDKKAPKCPACSAPLNLREIALPPGRGNENAYRSQWYCAAGECIYEEYSILTAFEQLKNNGLAGGERHIRRCNQER